MIDFEHDGVAAARRATSILTEHGLPSFPSARRTIPQSARLTPEQAYELVWADQPRARWRVSPDVRTALLSLHSASHAELPMVEEQLLGYPVDVDADAPAWTMEIRVDAAEVAANRSADAPDRA